MPQGGHLQIETSDVRLDDDYIHEKLAVIAKGHYALITVSDDGHGIPRGALAKEVARVRPDTQFLFVSGYAGKTILDHKVVDLETNFLQKPYTLRQLSSKIRKALDTPPRASRSH